VIRDFVVRGVGIAACAVTAILGSSAIAQQKEDSPKATVEVELRSPAGKPLAGVQVELASTEHVFPGQTRPTVDATTDAKGFVRFSWPVGLHNLQIMAAGIGYGATGQFELREGGSAHISPAPLVPFGAIEGVVATDSRAPSVYVEISSMSNTRQRRADCDKDGKFVFENLPASDYGLLLQPNPRPIWRLTSVAVRPGQRVCNVVIHKEKDMSVSREEAMMFGRGYDKAKEILWAAGTVHDENGKAVEGADVFVVINYYGGIRMYEQITAKKTDKAGRWEFHGSDSVPAFSGMLIACKPGHPYTHATMKDPMRDRKGDQGEKPNLRHYDFVLPSQGGALEVTVLRDGMPLKDAAVEIRRHNGPGIDDPHYVGSDRGPHRAVLEGLLTPSATTDGNGVARFTALVPGEYQITAIAGRKDDMWRLRSVFRSENELASATVDDVAVRAGSVTKRQVSLVLLPHYRRAIEVRRPDGRLFEDREIQVAGASLVSSEAASERPRKPDTTHVYSLDEPGLQRIEITAADPRAHRASAFELPHDEVAATIAASPLLPQKPDLALTAVSRKLGSLLIQVQGPSGKPLRGYVFIDRGHFGDVPAYAGTTDDRGCVRFEGFQANKHNVEVLIAGQEFVEFGDDARPLPSDKDLLGRLIVPKTEVEPAAGWETRLTVQAKPACYVRGIVKPPAGRKSADYQVYSDQHFEDFTYREHYDSKTGEFLVGPFPAGTAVLYVFETKKGLGDDSETRRDITVSGDRVARVEIAVPAQSEAAAKPRWHNARQAFLGMGGISMLGAGPTRTRGRVFLSDGKTPAYGAVMAFFVPEEQSPVGFGEADALGRLVLGGSWYSPCDDKQVLPGSPTEPVLVTWLPGSSGATINSLRDEAEARDLEIVLPPPLKITGKVTVGGKAARSRDCRLRVYAQYEGKGKLTAVLGRMVTPDADGNFKLSALTPGSYRVQAAMDGIWLSASVRMTVSEARQEPPPLTLDIGAPGPAITLKVADRQGRPVADATATVVRPEGPWADALWPREFVSDGAGAIHIPPLEVGTHRVQVRGAKERLVVVPPLADMNSLDVAEPIVVVQE